jgi:hypothetical protein
MTSTAVPAMKRMFLLACCALLADCRLIDQTTFRHPPEAKPPPPVAPAQTDPRRPLLTIGFDQPNPSYEDVLRTAVREAQRRNRLVRFDVVALVPASGDPAQSQRAASEVGEAIIGLGIPEARIRLGLRSEPTLPRQVRVYVHS